MEYSLCNSRIYLSIYMTTLNLEWQICMPREQIIFVVEAVCVGVLKYLLKEEDTNKD